jgi:hypothetical protein
MLQLVNELLPGGGQVRVRIDKGRHDGFAR